MSAVFLAPTRRNTFFSFSITKLVALSFFFLVTGGLVDPTKAISPDPPYFQGRYSNDKSWVDYFGERLGLTPTLFTALQGTTTIPTQGINFAFGGAYSGKGAVVPNAPIPGVQEQVGLFTQPLLTSNQKADPNALYTVWGGANDYFNNVSDPNQTVTNLSDSVESLASAGAKNILVFNLPDLGKTPLATATGNSSNLTTLSTSHNTALATALGQISSSNPGVNIIPVDIYSLFNRVIANPVEFGFKNVTDPCVIGDFQNISSVCNNPNDYLFFDAIHPTTGGYKLVAETALSAINAKSVPEPSAMLGILALGMGAAGVSYLRNALRA